MPRAQRLRRRLVERAPGRSPRRRCPSAPRCDRAPHRLRPSRRRRCASSRSTRHVAPSSALASCDAVARRDEERVRRRVVDEDEAPARMGLQEPVRRAASGADAGRDRGGGGAGELSSCARSSARRGHDGVRRHEPDRRERRRAAASATKIPASISLERPEPVRRAGTRSRAASRARRRYSCGSMPRLLRVQDGEVLAAGGDRGGRPRRRACC